jgi:hypothetical protein
MIAGYQNTNLGAVCVSDNLANTVYYSNGTDTMYKLQQSYQQPTTTISTPTKKEKKMAIDKNKRGLFQVILIDPKEKKMLLDKIVIADNIEDVLLEVDAGTVIKNAGLSVSDVDKIVNIIGQVRKTRKNKNGEVEIINEEIKD